MKVNLTEQQARSVAEAARVGLAHAKDMTPGDVAAAYVGVSILDKAWQASVGREVADGEDD